ncbi:hypothetical protein ATK78_2800 [Pedobacter metabolipauper]|uniref:Uncharacterized protein n=2 Tax=Pedobacter metabolipauper TaxID=425513 RepID=A0A4R6SVB0_9SPHI|nr:hypothetical protein ATK78_2800 [Pedobacter metabolipauper]
MLIISMNSFAQDEYPIIPKTGPSMESFIPKGWKVIMQRAGDLNKDGLADEAMVIQNTDLKNIIANEEGRMGGDTLDINPRMLIVLFKTSGGSYALAAKNVAFIPEQNDNERPCLLDPLLESDGITINKGLLKIQYKDFYSCGAWEVYVADYTFRYQNQKFELIGYDDYSMHRASGEEFSSSTNFSTFKQKSISGGNVFSEEKNKPKKVWKRIKPVKLLDLERLTEDVLNAFLVEIWK